MVVFLIVQFSLEERRERRQYLEYQRARAAASRPTRLEMERQEIKKKLKKFLKED